jgi:hypothetical protein
MDEVSPDKGLSNRLKVSTPRSHEDARDEKHIRKSTDWGVDKDTNDSLNGIAKIILI